MPRPEAAAPETAPEVPFAPPPPAPPPPAPPPPAPPPRAVAPPPAPPPPAPPPPRGDRRALKEMLGFADPQSTDPQPPAPPKSTTPAFRPPPPHAEDFAHPLPPLAFSQQDIDDFPIEPEEQTEEAADLTDADAEALEIAEDVPASADPSRDLAIEFLRRSPAMGAAEPAQPPPRASVVPPPAPPPPPALAPPAVAAPSPPAAAHTAAPKPIAAHTPAAAAFAMLAGEVARLGVPEGQRAAARAALTDMAQRLSSGTLKWDSVCQVLTMAAAYPELARRAVPLLVAFLDVE